MGLRLSMLHRHSPKSDRVGGEAAAPFAKGQGAASAQYEAAMQGPFPVYSVTEDYALSLELKKAGVKVRHTFMYESSGLFRLLCRCNHFSLRKYAFILCGACHLRW
jgi:hypothetical protein